MHILITLGLPGMKEDSINKFGNKIRKLRISLGLSQEELAARAGLHRTYIGMVEPAEKNITLKNIHKNAKALHVSLGSLFK